MPPETTGAGPFARPGGQGRVTFAMLAEAGLLDATAASITPALTIGGGARPGAIKLGSACWLTQGVAR